MEFAISGDNPDAKALRDVIQERKQADSVDTMMTDVMDIAQRYKSAFAENPQQAIGMALDYLAHPTDLSGQKVTIERVMAHAGLEFDAEQTYAPVDEMGNAAVTDKWDELTEHIGGELFADDEKIAFMRKLESEMPNADWEGFKAALIEGIQNGEHTIGKPINDLVI